MPKEDNKILKYNHGETSLNVPFIIYADLVFAWKISTCYNNPTKSSTTKINEHIPSAYSLFTHCSFDLTKIILIFIEVKTVWKGFVGI